MSDAVSEHTVRDEFDVSDVDEYVDVGTAVGFDGFVVVTGVECVFIGDTDTFATGN